MNVPRKERGTALIMALVMLLALTMLVVSSVNSTNNSLHIVGNMQIQNEIEVAIQQLIEKEISSLQNFETPTGIKQTINVTDNTSSNGSSGWDYSVTVAAPQCLYSVPAPGYSATLAGSVPNDTYWDVAASYTNQSTGATTMIHQGIKIRMPPWINC